jgi:hypothetical protein
MGSALGPSTADTITTIKLPLMCNVHECMNVYGGMHLCVCICVCVYGTATAVLDLILAEINAGLYSMLIKCGGSDRCEVPLLHPQSMLALQLRALCGCAAAAAAAAVWCLHCT